MRHLRRARAALSRYRRTLTRALSGPTAVALVSTAVGAWGIAGVLGEAWAAVVVGGLGLLAAVRMASGRRR